MNTCYKSEELSFERLEFNFKLYKSLIIHDYKKRALENDKT